MILREGEAGQQGQRGGDQDKGGAGHLVPPGDVGHRDAAFQQGEGKSNRREGAICTKGPLTLHLRTKQGLQPVAGWQYSARQ